MQFFDFDYDTIVNGPGFIPIDLNIKPYGEVRGALTKEVQFANPQMEMFDTMMVCKLPDGTVWLDFYSNRYAPNKTLMDFMVYCTDRWGLDSNHRGYPSSKDTELLKAGLFGRYWENVQICQLKRENRLSLSITMRVIIDNKDLNDFTKNLAEMIHKEVPPAPNTPCGTPTNGILPLNTSDGTVLQSQASDNFKSPVEITTKELSGGKVVLFVLICIFVFPIGNICIFIYGLKTYLSKNTELTWQESKLGTTTSIKRSVFIPATESELKIIKKNGIISMSIALGLAALIGLSLLLS